MRKKTDRKKPSEEKNGLVSLYLGLILGAAFLMALFMAMLVYMDEYSAGGEDTDILNHIASYKDDPEKVTAIVFGTSRTRNGLDFGLDPDIPAILPDGRELWSVQYAFNAATFKPYADLWESYLAVKPDYMIVLKSLATASRQSSPASLKSISGMLYKYVEYKLQGQNSDEARQEERSHIVDDCVDVYDKEEMQFNVTFTAYRDYHKFNESEDGNVTVYRDAVKQALDLGIKVIILDMTPNTVEMDKFNLPSHVLDYYGLGYEPTKEQLFPALHSQLDWIETPFIEKEYFCDLIHYNDKGREALTAMVFDRFLEIEKGAQH